MLLRLFRLTVGTALRVDAGFSQTEALDWPALDQMLLDDLLDVTHVYVSIPDGLGVDDDDRAVFALIEAAGLVGPDFMLHAGIFDRIFEG